jgi:hypothetical protein
MAPLELQSNAVNIVEDLGMAPLELQSNAVSILDLSLQYAYFN